MARPARRIEMKQLARRALARARASGMLRAESICRGAPLHFFTLSKTSRAVYGAGVKIGVPY